MAVYAEIKDIVANLGKKTKFMQPMYEAIVNALEANANKIVINVFSENSLFNYGHITGFSIEDDGDGFDLNNRNSFALLWTDNKRKMGCKGSGRFTWLSVFEDINIESYVKKENVKVNISFNLEYSEEKNCVTAYDVVKNRTIINFDRVKDRFYHSNKNGKNIDQRDYADPQKIKESIIDYLLIKLFLFKKNNKSFNIKINSGNSSCEINLDDVPELDSKEFEINSPITDESFKFELFYNFISDEKNSKKMYLCANQRSIKTYDDDSLGFSAGLPNKDSFNMLLCSEYFDGKDNDSRSDFDQLSNLKTASFDAPLLISEIISVTKKQMDLIIKEKYPQIDELNDKAVKNAIDCAPYLSHFIKNNNELIKSEKSLLVAASKQFNEEKENVKEKFSAVLKNSKIDDEQFNNAIKEINNIALAELGEYILFRENIIKALENSINSKETKEEIIHNIFMLKNTSLNSSSYESYEFNNIWLLDDKFMSYSYVASDKEYNQILTEIDTENKKRNVPMGNKKPDMMILYDNQFEKNVVVIEFKKPFATLNEKETAPAEIGRNIGIVKRNIENVSTIYGYIITSLDDEFVQSLIDNGYIPLFTNNSESKTLYLYNKVNNAHIFVLDLKTIKNDALSRNKTFLDILKNK